jgi:hypothetical protein
MSILSRRHIGPYILVNCLWIIVVAGMFYLVAKPVREPSIDFFGYYVSAAAIYQGESVYSPETHANIANAVGIRFTGPYTYLPTFAILMQPVVLMSPYVASLVWFGVNVGLLLIAVGLLFKQSNLQDHRLGVALLVLPVVFTPVLMSLYLGQVNFLILVLIVLAYMAFVRRRPYSAGLLLAVSSWIKFWPIVLIAYFVWKREWKVVLGALIGLLLVGVLTLTLADVGQTTDFFKVRLPEMLLGTYPDHDHINQSIPGVFAKMFAPSSDYVRPLIQSPVLAQYSSRIASLLIIVTTVILSSWPIALKDRKQFSTEFMLVVMACLLIAGWVWDSTLTLLLPAYFFIAEEWQQEHSPSWRQLALPIASIVLIDLHRVIWTLANPDRHALPWFLLSFPFLGLMLMWLIYAAMRLREIKTLKVGYSNEFIKPA